MQIQINTDSNIEGTEELGRHVRSMIAFSLRHLSDQITRVEVHLSDQNGKKSGQDDKRCVIEARAEGRQPTAVTHTASTVDDAVNGASGKLKRSLESTLDRLHDHR